jgi:hypothetical protein
MLQVLCVFVVSRVEDIDLQKQNVSLHMKKNEIRNEYRNSVWDTFNMN